MTIKPYFQNYFCFAKKLTLTAVFKENYSVRFSWQKVLFAQILSRAVFFMLQESSIFD